MSHHRRSASSRRSLADLHAAAADRSVQLSVLRLQQQTGGDQPGANQRSQPSDEPCAQYWCRLLAPVLGRLARPASLRLAREFEVNGGDRIHCILLWFHRL